MKKNNVIFNDSYYSELIRKHNYNPIDFKKINFSLKTLDIEALEKKFICHHDGDVFAKKLKDGKKTIITTGFGMSGNPHLGSISEMLKIIELQKAGLKTQIVLGDLDSYNARNQTLIAVRERVVVFKKFLENLGYNSKKGVMRDQFSQDSIIKTAFLVAHYLTDQDFDEAEEDISYIYKKEGVYKSVSFPMKMSLLLMVADFIHLGTVGGYENILITLGIEEHKYVLLTKKVMERMGLKFHIAAMYGKMIKGLSGYPKMCKSIKGSAIDVTTPCEEYRDLILSNNDERKDPNQNAIYQMMEQTSYYNNKELNKLFDTCKNGNEIEWKNARLKYIDVLDLILDKWPTKR
ncbi:MAG: hypothetical protein WCF94_03050 [bacterium]